MVEDPHDFDLVLKHLGILDHLLRDDLDHALAVRRFLHLGDVDHAVRPSAKDLRVELVDLANIVFSAFDEEVLFKDQVLDLLGLHAV